MPGRVCRDFPAVGGDFSFYQFPTPDTGGGCFRDRPSRCCSASRCRRRSPSPTGRATRGTAPRPGQPNEAFLNVRLFAAAFARPLEPYRDRVATLMFEFGTFSKAVFPNAAAFSASSSTRSWARFRRLSLRGRDPQPGVSRRRTISRCWRPAQHGPRLQRLDADARDRRAGRLPGAFTADFIAARALLRCGQTYENAVEAVRALPRDPGARSVDPRGAGRARRGGAESAQGRRHFCS